VSKKATRNDSIVSKSRSKMAQHHCTVPLQMQPWPCKFVPTSGDSGESVLKREIPS
jgi:hypothetical protein